MSERERKIELSGAQIIAGVLATLTAAVATSFLGVAGTLIGAAAVSIISTAGTAIYRYYLSRTGEKLRTAAPVVIQRVNVHGAAFYRGSNAGRRASQAAAPDQSAAQSRPTPGQESAWWEGGPAAANEATPAPGEQRGGPTGRRHEGSAREGSAAAPQGPRRPSWRMLAAAAGVILVTVMIAVTVIKIAAGKPSSSVVWGNVPVGSNATSTPQPHSPTPTSSAQSTSPSATPTPSSSTASTPTPTSTPSVGATSTASASPAAPFRASSPSPALSSFSPVPSP